jgi:hypothetical protein
MSPELSFIMPCLNEARTLKACITEIQKVMQDSLPNTPYEILVADNGSSDGSQQIAKDNGAIVVDVPQKGYGSAIAGGIKACQSPYAIIADSDLSYDFNSTPAFYQKLQEGHLLVMGNRFKGKILPGAMPFLHRYLGNPVLSFVGRLFFRLPIGDFHCGIRAINVKAIKALDLQTTGMEYASEMVVRAGLEKLPMTEVPTILRKDGRDRKPHLRTWRDGWRHLRFLLLYCPTWMFTVPGATLLTTGSALLLGTLPGPLKLGPITLDIHTLIFASVMMISGMQAISLGWLAQAFAETHGFHPKSTKPPHPNQLEHGILLGTASLLLGTGGAITSLLQWATLSFGNITGNNLLRLAIVSSLLIAFGLQCIFTTFAVSLAQLKTKT